MDFLTILNKRTAKNLNIILTLAFLICSWTLVSIAGAASPSLVNVGVSTQGNYITMDAILTDGIEGKILEAIESGVPMTVTFKIELRKQVTLWNDTLIRSNEVSHTVQFDSLKKAYRFSEVGKNVKRKIITQKKDRYQQLMATLNNIPIAPIYQLDPAEKYYVQVKANLEMDRFWFPFNYLFFFVPFNNFETSWAKTSPLTIDQEFLNSREAFNEKSKERAKSKALSHVIRSFNK